MIQWMLAIWSVSSAFSKTSLNIWKFSIHVQLKPLVYVEVLSHFESWRRSCCSQWAHETIQARISDLGLEEGLQIMTLLLQVKAVFWVKLCGDLLNEVAIVIIFITSTIVWSQVNSREGTQLHPSTENWIKVLLSMALPIRTRLSFPLSQSLPSGSFHEHLVLLHHKADRLKTTVTGS